MVKRPSTRSLMASTSALVSGAGSASYSSQVGHQAFVGFERSGSVAQPVVQLNEPAGAGLVVGGQAARPPTPLHRLGGVSLPLGRFGHCPGALGGSCPEAVAFLRQPILEFRGHVGSVEPGQQVAAIELQRIARPAVVERRFKRRRITPEVFREHRDLLVAPADDRLGAEGVAQSIEGLPEGRAGVLLIESRPQHGRYGVPPVVARRVGQRQIGEQGHPFGLRHDAGYFLAGCVANACSTEGSELDGHAGSVSSKCGSLKERLGNDQGTPGV